MHHGGPYPACSSPLHTSVGPAAIARFLRPVAYQGVPDPLLPEALRDANPLGIQRIVNGSWTRAGIAGSLIGD
jgi:NADP-dependent aldehyde dehydrogenase